jgi:hypothetical protein
MQWAGSLTCAAAVGFDCTVEGVCMCSAQQHDGCNAECEPGEPCHHVLLQLQPTAVKWPQDAAI